MDDKTTSSPSTLTAPERLQSLPSAAAFLREVQALTSPGRPLYSMAGRAAETIDQVRRELARVEGCGRL